MQLKAIKTYLDGHNVVFCVQTGYGKSLLFQLTSPLRHMLNQLKTKTLIISPLNSLLTTSLAQLRRHIPNYASNIFTLDLPLELLQQTEILLTSPEMLMTTEHGRLLMRGEWFADVGTVVIDEAHVIQS